MESKSSSSSPSSSLSSSDSFVSSSANTKSSVGFHSPSELTSPSSPSSPSSEGSLSSSLKVIISEKTVLLMRSSVGISCEEHNEKKDSLARVKLFQIYMAQNIIAKSQKRRGKRRKHYDLVSKKPMCKDRQKYFPKERKEKQYGALKVVKAVMHCQFRENFCRCYRKER